MQVNWLLFFQHRIPLPSPLRLQYGAAWVLDLDIAV